MFNADVFIQGSPNPRPNPKQINLLPQLMAENLPLILVGASDNLGNPLDSSQTTGPPGTTNVRVHVYAPGSAVDCAQDTGSSPPVYGTSIGRPLSIFLHHS
jgi:hypothetical protein